MKSTKELWKVNKNVDANAYSVQPAGGNRQIRTTPSGVVECSRLGTVDLLAPTLPLFPTAMSFLPSI